MTDPMDEFALRRSVGVRSGDGRMVILCEDSTTGEAGPKLHELAWAAITNWSGRWNMISVHMTPLFPTPWGGAPRSDIEHHSRISALIRRAYKAGILDAACVGHVPSGWVPVMERAVFGLTALMTHPSYRPATITIRQVKEKLGTLRFYAEGTGSSNARACVSQISTWAEVCTESRCMLTGAPGILREGDWLLTLSDDAVRLWGSDPEAFAARLYPALR